MMKIEIKAGYTSREFFVMITYELVHLKIFKIGFDCFRK